MFLVKKQQVDLCCFGFWLFLCVLSIQSSARHHYTEKQLLNGDVTLRYLEYGETCASARAHNWLTGSSETIKAKVLPPGGFLSIENNTNNTIHFDLWNLEWDEENKSPYVGFANYNGTYRHGFPGDVSTYKIPVSNRKLVELELRQRGEFIKILPFSEIPREMCILLYPTSKYFVEPRNIVMKAGLEEKTKETGLEEKTKETMSSEIEGEMSLEQARSWLPKCTGRVGYSNEEIDGYKLKQNQTIVFTTHKTFYVNNIEDYQYGGYRDELVAVILRGYPIAELMTGEKEYFPGAFFENTYEVTLQGGEEACVKIDIPR